MTPEQVAQFLERFPHGRDLVAEQQAADAQADAAWAVKEQEWKAAAEAAKAEGKPAPRPLRREDAPAYRYRLPTFLVAREDLVDACRWLRDNPEVDMAVLEFVSAVDWPDRLEIVYHVASLTHGHALILKAPMPRDDARVPSVMSLWRGADWHEREAYDLFGIVFEGHPDLRRIMMSADWKGNPLRKDYVYEDPQWLVDLASQRQKEIAATGEGWEGRGSRT